MKVQKMTDSVIYLFYLSFVGFRNQKSTRVIYSIFWAEF